MDLTCGMLWYISLYVRESIHANEVKVAGPFYSDSD